MKKFKTILLDMDGVLVNFQKHCFDIFNLDYENINNLCVWDMSKLVGLSGSDFFKTIKEHGPIFLNCEPYPWYKELIELCKQYTDNLVIASSPIVHYPETYTEKIYWLNKHDINEDNGIGVMLGVQKELMANPDTVLIDDSDKNITKFRKEYGKTITFPQYYNNTYRYSRVKMEYVTQELNRL